MKATSILKNTLRLSLLVSVVAACMAQSKPMGISTTQDESRGIIPEKFVNARPKRSGPVKRAHVAYKKVASESAMTESAKPTDSRSAQIGLTVWRLRKSISSDGAARILEQEEAAEWTPIRVEASTPLAAGDRVRLSIESSREGYLYVIDREQYEDGSLGQPLLIFPTMRTRGGDNRVKPGRLIDIPAQDDRPSFFRLKTIRAEHVAELITILVTREPIVGLSIGPERLILSKELMANWENSWSRKSEHFELEGGQGKTWTKEEQLAAVDATRELTQEDAPPQSVFRIANAPGTSIMVSVPLRILRKE